MTKLPGCEPTSDRLRELAKSERFCREPQCNEGCAGFIAELLGTADVVDDMQMRIDDLRDRSIPALAAEIMACRMAHGFETTKENMLGKLMLVVTEIAEAAEDVRHERWDHFPEEIADAMIRLLDITSALGIDIETAMRIKMSINWSRAPLHGTKVTT